jgi:hypothetical protein
MEQYRNKREVGLERPSCRLGMPYKTVIVAGLTPFKHHDRIEFVGGLVLKAKKNLLPGVRKNKRYSIHQDLSGDYSFVISGHFGRKKVALAKVPFHRFTFRPLWFVDARPVTLSINCNKPVESDRPTVKKSSPSFSRNQDAAFLKSLGIALD